jgi:photosynthetic reaction center cytochrome c subunit
MPFRQTTKIVIIAIALQMVTSLVSAQSTDFELYKTKVEPIFLKHRAGHARCVACHAGQQGTFSLQPLSSGNTTWTAEQSRLNYESVSQWVSPGKPTSSPLLMHPLAPEEGGDVFHDGGHQFASQNDPDWQTIAEWIREKPKVEYKNLKLLTSSDRLMDTMRFFDVSLRQECNFCHATSDFSSDKNPRKAIARNMIQMTQKLNESLGQGKVNCYTCHRGDMLPMTTHPRYPQLGLD